MEQEEKIDHRYMLIISLILAAGVVGSLAVVYVLLWAWSTYGIFFFPLLIATFLGLIGVFSLWNYCKKRRSKRNERSLVRIV